MRRFVALVYFWLASTVGCASAWRPASGAGKATAKVVTLTHLSVDDMRVIKLRVVTVNNPTDEEVLVDCVSLRWRIGPHLQQDALLMPGDRGCDLHAAEDYSPNTGDSIPIPDVPIGVTVKATNNGGRP